MTPGKFITFEGIDASGKTTNIEIAANHLRNRGYKVVTTREPGGSGVRASEQIRSMLLSDEFRLDQRTELFLFAAARAEHVAKLIKPALEKGSIVISDRFADSTYAYQCHGRQIAPQIVLDIERLTLGTFEPDHTLFFDLPIEESYRRLAERSGQHLDHFDRESGGFRLRVCEGYQHRFVANPHRMFRIDALPEKPAVAQQVINWLNAHFDNLN